MTHIRIPPNQVENLIRSCLNGIQEAVEAFFNQKPSVF
jgi:hypothetical protein